MPMADTEELSLIDTVNEYYTVDLKTKSPPPPPTPPTAYMGW